MIPKLPLGKMVIITIPTAKEQRAIPNNLFLKNITSVLENSSYSIICITSFKIG